MFLRIYTYYNKKVNTNECRVNNEFIFYALNANINGFNFQVN